MRKTTAVPFITPIAALDELDAIVHTKGIDAFEIGTGDLSASMGKPGQASHPEVQGVVNKFVAAVLDAGSVIGDTVTDGPSALELFRQGYRMLDCGFDGLARGALSSLLTEARKALEN